MNEETAASTSERLTVVSIDGHAGPPVSAYRDYLESEYVELYDRYISQVEAYDAAESAEGARTPLSEMVPANVRGGRNAPMPGLWDPEVRKRDMDADGIAAEVIFPQGSVPFHRYPALGNIKRPVDLTTDQRVLSAGIRAYNRWLSDFCSSDPRRYIGIGVVPIADLAAAEQEARTIRASGLCGGISLPPIVPGRAAYNDPVYERFWSVCEDLNLPLNVHGGGVATYFGDGPEAMALRLAETDWYMQRTMWYLIFAGVFERHPGLRLVFTELRAHWVAPEVSRLDSIYESKMANIKGYLPASPSVYFARNCYIGASFMSRHESESLDAIGRQNLMWGRDYPHREGCWPWTMESLRKTFAGLPEEDIRLMVGENAVRCYSLDRSYLQGIAATIGPTLEEISTPLEAIPAGAEYSWGFREIGAFA